MERPSLEPIEFSLTVPATLDHRPSDDSDDLTGGVLWGGWNGGDFIWYCGMIEGEKDGAEESCRLIIGIWLKLFIDIDDES